MNKIHILKHHYNNKTTVVLGEYCINGCQTFHTTEAEAVFRDFSVSVKHQNEVNALFSKFDKTQQFDFSSLDFCDIELMSDIVLVLRTKYDNEQVIDYLLNHYDVERVLIGMALHLYTPQHIDKLIKHENSHVREKAVEFCNKEQLNELMVDPYWKVRVAVASCGSKNNLDFLVCDEYAYVRAEVAKRGFKEHLDILVHDKSVLVRCVVARVGYNNHLDILVNDKKPQVRVMVARFGRKNHLDTLIDSAVNVETRIIIAERGNKEHLKKLLHDPSEMVREMVACCGNPNILSVLVHDESVLVREKVAWYGGKELLKLLTKDVDEEVRNIASLRLKKYNV